MNFQTLCQLLEMPAEAMELLEQRALADTSWLSGELIARYYNRSTADEGLKAIQSHLGEDPDGLRLLHLLLSLALDTWKGYEKAGIPQDVFISTMKFVPRFLHTQMHQHGNWHFIWGWWFWRQLSMMEFRIGCLEYELVENPDGSREISLHIPSDADLSPASVDASFAAFRQFLAVHFPHWQDVPWVCDSWMMAPGLRAALDPDSNILAFQLRFDPLHHSDYEAVMDWVFPPHREISENLPERTSLQRRLKALLLGGAKIGCTKARLRD